MKRYKKPGDIKVGVLGYGGAFNMGKRHMDEMKQAGMKPFAVCEIDPERLQVAERDFPGVELYRDLDTMLKRSDVDLIVHITPHNLHYPLAAKCLKAGKHVVTEKPFVITTDECDKLIKAAQQKKLLVSTYHNRHWDGWIMRAKQQVVDKGIIGDVFRVEAHMDAFGGYAMPKDWWRTSKSISGGVLYDWGCHLLEYCLQVVQSEITEVSGFTKTGYWESQAPKSFPWIGDMNEDEAHAIVRFANGCMLHLSVSHLRSEHKPPYTLAFVGTKGAYEIADFQTWRTRIPNRRGEMVETTGKHPASKGHLFYKNIADYMTGKDDLVITPQWARRPIHILDLANRSARQGRALPAKYG